MDPKSVAHATLDPDEILLARSNTPDLVGRAAVYGGGPPSVVASDLLIRVRTGPQADPSYVGFYLSHLYLSGYWTDRAGGASGTMKKIRRSQVRAVEIPLPPLVLQRRVADDLSRRRAEIQALLGGLRAQREAVGALPGSILGEAFAGAKVTMAD